ncbi:DNA-binding protein [Edwardsiella tarda]|uniref:baseplate complex protein n=1 Tax=Edwardsiella tarda TaxID=636 RepID=UPI00244389AA|nr:DNA-binding protein [Edwardsiella tarda]WGE29404.1 DNA-binding protein [Edwardsiella tarda]
MRNGIALLALSGQVIPLKRLSVSIRMNIRDKDSTGQESGTAASEQGIKAKELQISGLIPYDEPETLALLFRLAEAKTPGGAQQVYRINNHDAQAINMQQGVFSSAVGAAPEMGLMAWKVDFTLKERNSSAEKAAGRGPASAKQVEQHAQAGEKATPDDAATAPHHHGKIWAWSQKLNDWIGPAGDETNTKSQH